jgi:hypothetical protein
MMSFALIQDLDFPGVSTIYDNMEIYDVINTQIAINMLGVVQGQDRINMQDLITCRI